MKRITSVLLALCMICSLSACFVRDTLPSDTFFTQETLAEYSLTGMPVPNLTNSRLKEDRLYCNLTMDEYADYVSSVLTWLQGREDIFHLGSYCSSGLYGEMLPYRVYSFLPEDYDCRGSSHDFAFSATETLSNDFMDDPIRIMIYRESDNLGRSRFTYNTVIDIGTILSASFDPCYRQHSYGQAIPYPIPGLGKSVNISYCVYCGNKTQDWYYGNDNSYSVRVTHGKNRIHSTNFGVGFRMTSCYSGLMVEIHVRRVQDGHISMFINDEEIPILRDEGTYITFGFIMPECDIEIQIIVITE